MRWAVFFKKLLDETRDPLMKKKTILELIKAHLSVKERLQFRTRIERIEEILYRQKGLPINEYFRSEAIRSESYR